MNNQFDPVEFNKNVLYKLYWKDRLTLEQIASKFGVVPSTIYRKMKKYGIPTRETGKAHKTLAEERPQIDNLQQNTSYEEKQTFASQIKELFEQKMREAYNNGFRDGINKGYHEGIKKGYDLCSEKAIKVIQNLTIEGENNEEVKNE
jgi:flagellar biosynthesis/type III secretory pathway protein FliH